MVDTLEKPEFKPKKERSVAQKKAFEKARLALAEKRRVAREKKDSEPKKPRGRPVKKQIVNDVPIDTVENTSVAPGAYGDNKNNINISKKEKNIKKTQVIIDDSSSSSEEEIIYVKNKHTKKKKVKKQPKIVYVSASESSSEEEEYYTPPQQEQQQQPTFMYV